MAKPKETPVVNTMICLTCGAEQFFPADVPSSLKCKTCGSTVFRAFSTPTKPDEVTESQLEETARSVALGDVSPDSTRGDLRELNDS